METVDQATKELLGVASQAPKGVVLQDYNPTERYPRVAVGDGFEVGQTITGWYEETLTVASAKFKYGESKNENGVNQKSLHVFRIGSPTGPRLGIWGVTDLNYTLENVTPGTLLAITYKGKGLGENGNAKHFFEYKKQVAL